MAERVILTIGTKKGLFVAEAAKTAAQLRAARALRPRRRRLLDAHRHARHAAPLRLELQPVLRHEGPALDRPGQDASRRRSRRRRSPRTTDARSPTSGRSRPGAGKKDLWCGVEPASLFRSRDGGDSWEMVPGISNHEHARKWQPGNGGLCMHTIIRDGNRVHLGISTGGHYLSEDGGETFKASNQGVGAGFAPDPYPEFGQCVHKIARHEDAPGRLYMQNHGGWAEWDGPGGPRPDIGVLRSDDHGHSWRSIAKGLPSDFGFPIVVHPHDADTVYVHAARAGRRAPVPAARPRSGAARTAATRGAGSPAGCRRSRATSPSCATRWTSTSSSRPRSTSARRPVSSGSGGTAARSGTACSIRCRRSTA